MAYTDRAIEALGVAEATLRDIIKEALAANAYRDLAKVASAVDKVAALVRELDGSTSVAILVNAPSGHEAQSQLPHALAIQPSTAPMRTTGRSSIAASRRSAYPQFMRDGDKLVKVAWSKKERRPYEHRAPRAIIQALLDAVRKHKGDGKLFDATDVLPLLAENGEEYPSYQSYLALAWLRQVGIVTKKGREGYIIKPGMATTEQVARFWQSLPSEE